MARLIVFFNSPINAGSIEVTCSGEPLAQVPFDFTTTNFLKMKRKGTGQVKRTLAIPSGRQTVSIRLIDQERGLVGERSFTERFPSGTDWTLRVDLPPNADQAEFYLVKASR
jgi:hypothetical protein